MHTLAMNTRPRRRLHTFDVAPNLGSTKLPAAIIFAVLTLTVLALLLLFALPAQAQTEAALYNFTGGSDGATPESRLTPDTAGNF